MEQGEADRLLDLRVAVDLDVGACPEIVQVGTLLGDQAVPAHLGGGRKRSRHLVSHRRPRTLRGPAVGDELHEVQPFSGRQGRRYGHPARSGKLSALTCSDDGPSTRWSMAEVRRRPLVLVECDSVAAAPPQA